MKHILLSAAAASLIAGSAIAGGYTAPVVEAPVIAPVAPVAVSDWTGFYAGVQYGTLKYSEDDFGDIYTEDGERSYGIHAGYLHDFGQFVLGAELDHNRLEWGTGWDNWDPNMTRLRARAGYDLGRVLPYLTAGVAQFSEDGFSDTGLTYGIGVDFKATERFSVGLEYSRSSFEWDEYATFDLDMLQLRASYRF